MRLGLIASFRRTARAPLTPKSSAVTASPLRLLPMTILPSRSFMSLRLVVRAKMAISSLPTEISNCVCGGQKEHTPSTPFPSSLSPSRLIPALPPYLLSIIYLPSLPPPSPSLLPPTPFPFIASSLLLSFILPHPSPSLSLHSFHLFPSLLLPPSLPLTSLVRPFSVGDCPTVIFLR